MYDSYISVVIDRSGSMIKIKAATMQGYNEFLVGQKAEPGTAKLKLVQFDHTYVVAYNGDLQEAPPLTDANYSPLGSTALLDAIGRNINEIGEELSALPEAERPKQVIMAIQTDGEENASRKFDKARVFEMISLQRDVYKWNFMFLGAGEDAINDAAALGIDPDLTLSYDVTPTSMFRSFDTLDVATKSLRSTGVYKFTDEDKLKVKQA